MALLRSSHTPYSRPPLVSFLRDVPQEPTTHTPERHSERAHDELSPSVISAISQYRDDCERDPRYKSRDGANSYLDYDYSAESEDTEEMEVDVYDELTQEHVPMKLPVKMPFFLLRGLIATTLSRDADWLTLYGDLLVARRGRVPLKLNDSLKTLLDREDEERRKRGNPRSLWMPKHVQIYVKTRRFNSWDFQVMSRKLEAANGQIAELSERLKELELKFAIMRSS